MHAFLPFQDFSEQALSSGAKPFEIDLSDWDTTQFNMVAENATRTNVIWGVAASVTSFSRRTVPETTSATALLLLGAALLARRKGS